MPSTSPYKIAGIWLILWTGIGLKSCTTSEKKPEDTATFEAGIVQPEHVEFSGDFNGDGKTENAILRMTVEGKTESESWVFTLIFSDPAIPSYSFQNSTEIPPKILSEGQLNDLPGDEFSIVTQAPNLGLAVLSVYSLVDGSWYQSFPGVFTQWVLPDSISFQDIVQKENNKLVALEYDPGSMGIEEEEEAREAGFYKTEVNLYKQLEPVGAYIGDEIIGRLDADGDGTEELMRVVTVFEKEGETVNRLEFNNPKIKPITLGECYEVVSEGDLDGDKFGELSILACGIMPNYNFLTVLSFTNKKWVVRLEGIRSRNILPDGLTREDIIFREGSEVFYYEDEELDNFNGLKEQLKKTKAALKP